MSRSTVSKPRRAKSKSTPSPQAALKRHAGKDRWDRALIVPRRLPRGLSSLPQEVVAAAQRSRLIEATGHVVAEKGYAATSVADLIAYAGVSRTTFYQLFKDKEDCFLFCMDKRARSHLEAMTNAFDPSRNLPEQMIDALTVHMRCIDDDHWFARTFIAEAEAATPLIRQAFEKTRDPYGRSIKDWFAQVCAAYPEVQPRPPLTLELVHAALNGYVATAVRTGVKKLEDDVPVLAEFLFSALGLHGWAEHVRSGAAAFGAPQSSAAARVLQLRA